MLREVQRDSSTGPSLAAHSPVRHVELQELLPLNTEGQKDLAMAACTRPSFSAGKAKEHLRAVRTQQPPENF